MAASGATDIDVGAFPGVDSYTTTIAAAGCTAASQVEAWILPAATADHSVDEHLVDPPRVIAHSPAAGSFSVTLLAREQAAVFATIALKQTSGSKSPGKRNSSAFIFGTWHVGWVHS